jgi:separase
MPSKTPAAAKAARKVPAASNDTTWDVEELKNMLYPPGDSENPDLKVDAVDPRKGLKTADEIMNKASSALTTLISGKKGPGKEVEAIAKACRIALDGYRKWSDRKLEIERRASSLASKLITLEAYGPARQVLDDMRPHVLALYDHAPPNTSPLTLPLPLQELPDELVRLLTNTLVHRIWTSRDEDSFASDLILEGSIFSWVALSADDTLKRAFTALSKSKHFSARILGLKCVVNTTELDPDAFWGQACYYASTFAKTITDKNEERRVCAEVSNAYGDLVALAAARENFLEGEIFVKFCKFWLSFARKACLNST